MKRKIAYIFAGLLLSITPAIVQAEYELQDVGSENITAASSSSNQQNPFHIQIEGDWVAPAKFKHHDNIGKKLHYTFISAGADAVVWYNDCHDEGLNLGIDYDYTNLRVDCNDFFHRKVYNTLTLEGSFFTHRLCDWYWVANVSMNIDADKWNLSDYLTWNMLLWGRYDVCQNWGVHAGLYVETGMKLDRVLPILGFDWTYCNWKINAVYPMNVSIEYKVDNKWTVSAAGRFFSNRQRAGRSGDYEKAVWRYTNTGIELAVINTSFCGLTANLHGGYAFGGRLKVADRHTHHSHRLRFDGSAYAGGELSYRF